MVERINEFSDEELSKEIKEELSHIIENYNTLKIIVKNLPPNFRQIIEDLRLFKATYSVYKERGYKKSIPLEVGRVAKKIKKSLMLFKNEAILDIVMNGSNTILQNFKEILRENLYKSTMSLNEKSKINKIIQKKGLKDEDKNELISIFIRLPTEELKSLLFVTPEDRLVLLPYLKGGTKKLIGDPKDISYTTLELIDDLKTELEKIFLTHFPERIEPISYRGLSKFWQDNYYFVYNVRRSNNIKSKSKELDLLSQKLINKYGNEKVSKCLKIIEDCKNNKIEVKETIDLLTHEIAVINEEIKISQRFLSELFGMDEEYITQVKSRYSKSAPSVYDPNYKIPIEYLTRFISNLRSYIGRKAASCFELIDKYMKSNPDLKRYALQQVTISNWNAFHNLDEDNSYWLGFLVADGWIANLLSIGRKRYDIQLQLSSKDENLLRKFADFVGYDRERISHYKVRSKKVPKYFSVSRIYFGSKEMHEDLTKLGIFDSKGQMERRQVPQSIVSKIIEAKKIDNNLSRSEQGRIALRFLLGFFDGDGWYDVKSNGRAVIYSSSKPFLEQVKSLYGVKNKVQEKPPKDVSSDDLEEINIAGKEKKAKPSYWLTLGPKLYYQIISVYNGGLKRKRPQGFQNNPDFLGV